MNKTPILFVDVDGPLNPFSAPAHRRPEGYGTIYLDINNVVHQKKPRGRGSFRVWLNKSHGEEFMKLSAEGLCVTWATKWNHLANTVINAYWGVPEFPVAEVSSAPEVGCKGIFFHHKGCKCLHSKTETLLEYANGAPFIWFDDEVSESDMEHVVEKSPSSLVVQVSPRVGMTALDFQKAREWLSGL